MRCARSALLPLIILAACGSGDGTEAGNTVMVDTYLSTPDPGSASRDAAARRCRARGQGGATHIATRDTARRTVRHVFRCG
ncbi:hypothetical protein [Palleronia pelagia]|uniref:Lipoprotein n=1 Tax=Palleronia pelagia TaxID=387096 RepID=A0A1H8A4L9_9RHOB|nr:hypothetical protein [Palleronia pelagia]SEM65695.1 hypothetical protein SAMN04488011_10111 [Palleronia pelagia]